jgi:N-acetylneuraminic acid mutarotase
LKILIGILMGFLALTLVTPLVSASTLSTGLWVSTANLNAARRDAASVRLQDGKVLVIGGWNAASLATEPFASAELYDPVADSWSYAASMTTPRTFPTATLLKNGKVLVTGGANSGNDWLASTELYDPTHNTWTSSGNLPVGVYEQSATLLADGRVLVAGGSATGNVSTNVASIYDPTSNSWTQVASMTYPRLAHRATLLKNGKVLVDGGWSTQTGGTESSAELYDPVANTWSSAGSPAARDQQSAVLLSTAKCWSSAARTGRTIRWR